MCDTPSKRWELHEPGLKTAAWPWIVTDTDGDQRAAFKVRGDGERYTRDRNRTDGIATETGDAHGEIEEHLRGRLDDIAALQKIARGDVDEFSNDEILALDLAYGQPGPIPASQLEEEAGQRLDEFPLAVEATTTFEIVLGTGGPDDRLLIECDGGPTEEETGAGYEIRRCLYRYSWTGSAERVLTGADKEAAEELARRVVPELVE